MDILFLAEAAYLNDIVQLSAYGPLLAGTVIFLVIWVKAVKPILDNNKADLDALREITRNNESTARSNMQTMQSLERALQQLKGITETMAILQNNCLHCNARKDES